MKRLLRALLAGLALLPALACAFDLGELQRQLGTPAVVRGQFVQEKHLRGLPQPLTSQGRFVLAREHGLLWLLHSPLAQDYRIDASGIARRTPAGWQRQDQQERGSSQQRLFLAVLQGDSHALERDFALELSGQADAWQLRLTPRAALLQQIFTRIEIRGGALVEEIVLYETQGDQTRLRLQDSQVAAQPSDAERHAFAD